MIDFDDAETASILSFLGPWWIALPLAVVTVILYLIAGANSDDCAEKHCATGTPQLMENECLCVETAK